MYTENLIIESWKNLVGWRQNYDPNGEMLEDSLTQSDTGLYYQDVHPLLTLNNLESVAPDHSEISYPEYNASTSYLSGAIVDESGTIYKALRDNTGQTPSTSTDDWKEYNPFSEWLETKTKAGIVDVLSNYLTLKTLKKTASPLLENKTIFDGVGNVNDLVTNKDRRAGFEIIPSKSKGLNTRIDRIGLQFTDEGEVTIQLHHSSQKEPLKTSILDYSKEKSVQWFNLGWNLPFVSDDNDSGGAYYLTYKQTELAGQAIRKKRYWDREPCSSCATIAETNTWRLYSKHLEINPFEIPETGDDYIWDVDDNRYSVDTNYGLNLSISIYCDYTQFFIDQKEAFKDVLRKQVAINLLREIAYNPNSNISQNTNTATTSQILYEIDGDGKGVTGMYGKYTNALKAIEIDTRGLDRVCLPCKKNGIKYRSV